MFTNGLNRNLSVTVHRIKLERETMSTPDLVNVKNQLVHTREESLRIKTAKMCNFQVWLKKLRIQNQKPSFYYYWKVPGDWKRNCPNFKHFTHPQDSEQSFQCPSNSKGSALRNYSGSSQTSLRIGSEKLFSKLGKISLCPYWHRSYSLGAQPQCYTAAPASENENSSNSGGLKWTSTGSCLWNCSFSVRSLRITHPFLHHSSVPLPFLTWNFLESIMAGVSFSQEGEIILEFDSIHENSQSGKLKELLAYFICSISDDTIFEAGSMVHLSLLDHLSFFLGVIFSWYRHNTKCTPYQDSNNSLNPRTRINIPWEVFPGIKPTVDPKTQGLIPLH